MVFPATALGVTVELHLGATLGWVNITDDVRLGSAHSGGGISISDRGRTNESGDAQTMRCQLVINNRSGAYSPRNPASPYYGLLGRNTPIRVRVADTDPGGALAVDGRRGAGSTAPGAAVTAAHTSLNGTGDLDVRVWLRMSQWNDHGGVFVAGKQDAWSLAVGDTGNLEFRWVNGSTVMTTTTSGANLPVPLADGSLALRVVLTVATGVRTFYTAPTIAGPWVQLSQSTWGATDIKAAPTFGVEVGRVSSFGDHGVNGELYGMELRSGGTLVASPDFTKLRAGDTQLVDAQGRTWTWAGGAVPVDRGARFHGEVSSWPPRWDLSGNDRWVPIEAAGITQRLSQGNSPVQSPLRRSLTAIDPAAYLPLEDGAEATRPTSAAVGVASATSSKVTYGVEAGRLAGTVSVAQMTDAGSVISTPVATRTLSSTWSLLVFFKLSALPVGVDQTYLRLFSQGGTASRWDFQLSGGGYRWIGYDKAGNVVDDRNFASVGQPPTDWLMMYVEWRQVAGTVAWDTWVANAGETLFSHGSYSYSGTVGNPTRADIIGNSYFVNALVSHLAVDNQRIFLSDDFAEVSTGYLGESAGARIARLAAEEGLPLTVWGYPHDTVTMGPQPIAPLLDVLRDAAAADGGLLLEGRGHLGLAYRTRASLYNQTAIALDYAAGHIAAPFEPTDDDDATRNDITLTRPDGGSARAVQTSGPLSVLSPPDGVGTYDTSDTVNVATDDDLPDQAGWRLHLGTVDEARYPRVRLNLAGQGLAADQALTRRMALADAGDVLSIASLPAWLPPGPAEAMAQGYTEAIDAYEWSITFNATPASRWDVAVADGEARVPADGTTLASALGTDTPNPLNANPYLETDASDWFGYGAAVARSTAQAHQGVASLLLTPDGVSAQAVADSGQVPVTAGVTYRAAAWVRCSVARGVHLGVNWYDVAHGYLSTSSQPDVAVAANTWTPLSFTAVAPAGAAYASVNAVMWSTPPASHLLYIDEATIGRLVTLQITSTPENGTWTEDVADFPLDMRVGAEQVTAAVVGPSFADTFTRTVASGLGTADSGPVWTTSGGAASDYSTNGTVGRISNGSVNVQRYALVDLGTTDPTFVIDITNPLGTPSGAPVTHWVLVRAADASNYYCARLDINTSGSTDLVLVKRVAGVLSGNLASAPGIGTHSSNTWRVMVSARGSTLRAKAWKTTTAEPGWQVEATDTSLTAGTLGGLGTRLEGGNTNTLPVVVSLDNARVLSPQLVTLSARGVNGVSRAWPAGTEVDVWQPAVLAL